MTGKPKSGMPWKMHSARSNVVDKDNKKNIPGQTFEDRMKKKQEIEDLKAFEKSLIDERVERKRALRKKREANKKRKELNQFKSGTYDVIKDTSKIKKWTKKNKSKLLRIPPEVFYDKMNKQV